MELSESELKNYYGKSYKNLTQKIQEIINLIPTISNLKDKELEKILNEIQQILIWYPISFARLLLNNDLYIFFEEAFKKNEETMLLVHNIIFTINNIYNYPMCSESPSNELEFLQKKLNIEITLPKERETKTDEEELFDEINSIAEGMNLIKNLEIDNNTLEENTNYIYKRYIDVLEKYNKYFQNSNDSNTSKEHLKYLLDLINSMIKEVEKIINHKFYSEEEKNIYKKLDENFKSQKENFEPVEDLEYKENIKNEKENNNNNNINANLYEIDENINNPFDINAMDYNTLNQHKDLLNNSEDKNKIEISKVPLKNRTFFYLNEKLISDENNEIEYKDYSYPLPDRLKEALKIQMCAFLNAKGGRIYIGITDDNIVTGYLLDHKDRDIRKLDITNLLYDFYPSCRLSNPVDVVFIPVKDYYDNKYIFQRYVIKIIVHQGDPKKLYSICNKGGYLSYLRGDGKCMFLKAEEIYENIIKRHENPEPIIPDSEFVDPLPEVPNEDGLIQDMNINYYDNMKTNLKYNINNIKNMLMGHGIKNLNEKNYNFSNQSSKRPFKKKKSNSVKLIDVKISNISSSLTDNELRQMFKIYSPVSMKFCRGNDGKSYGHLNFDDMQLALITVSNFNGKVYGGLPLILKIKEIE